MRVLRAIAIAVWLALTAGCAEEYIPAYPGIERLNEQGMPANGSGLPPGETAPGERYPAPSGSGGIPEMLEKYAPDR